MLKTQVKMNKFFKIQMNYNRSPPYTFADVYKHLLDCGITSTTKILSTSPSHSNQVLPVAIVNSGKMSREDVHRNISNRGSTDKRLNNNSKYRHSNGSGIQKNDYIKKRCECCGLTNREVHQLIHKYHDGTAKTCILRGPELIPDKHIRETVTQFNVKAKNMKRPPLPPKATLPSSPKVNLAHQSQAFDQEYDSEEDFYSKLLDQGDSFYQDANDEYFTYDHMDAEQELTSSPNPNVKPTVNMTQTNSPNETDQQIPYTPKMHSATRHHRDNSVMTDERNISHSSFQDMLNELTFTDRENEVVMKAVNLSPSEMLPDKLMMQDSMNSTPAFTKIWD